jgi:hypothetical protein
MRRKINTHQKFANLKVTPAISTDSHNMRRETHHFPVGEKCNPFPWMHPDYVPFQVKGETRTEFDFEEKEDNELDELSYALE